MKLSELILGLFKIPFDFIAGMLAFLVAYQLRTKTDLIPGIDLPLDITTFPGINDYINFSAAAIAALIFLLAMNRAYSLKKHVRLSREISQVMLVTATWIMLIIAYFFIIREFPFSRLVLGYAWILTALLISLDRAVIRLVEFVLLKSGIGKRKLLFIGANEVTGILANAMKKDLKYRIVGLIDDNLREDTRPRCLGKVADMESIVKKYDIEEILQTKSDLSDAQATDIRDFCREHQIIYRFVPDLLTIQQTNIEVETLKGIPVISLKPTPLDGWGRVLKRIFDITGSLAGLIILSPVMLVTAVAIKLDSKGTILFKYLDDGSRVKRVGQQGRLFNFYKFRSMHPKTHNLRYTELAGQNTRKGTPMVKIKNDPRVTRVGRFIRKTSIDELPQLFNVLIGNMSLVGPRPHLPEEVANYQRHHKFALTIKPGITGLAQISGRSDLDFEEENQLDTYYIENWSLWKDIKIILKTVGVVFRDYQE